MIEHHFVVWAFQLSTQRFARDGAAPTPVEGPLAFYNTFGYFLFDVQTFALAVHSDHKRINHFEFAFCAKHSFSLVVGGVWPAMFCPEKGPMRTSPLPSPIMTDSCCIRCCPMRPSFHATDQHSVTSTQFFFCVSIILTLLACVRTSVRGGLSWTAAGGAQGGRMGHIVGEKVEKKGTSSLLAGLTALTLLGHTLNAALFSVSNCITTPPPLLTVQCISHIV